MDAVLRETVNGRAYRKTRTMRFAAEIFSDAVRYIRFLGRGTDIGLL
jgi:hypothetical protein